MKPDSATWIDSPPKYPMKQSPFSPLFTSYLPLTTLLHLKCILNANQLHELCVLGTTNPRRIPLKLRKTVVPGMDVKGTYGEDLD